MLTEKQIEDQQEFERKRISGGLHKLRSNHFLVQGEFELKTKIIFRYKVKKGRK